MVNDESALLDAFVTILRYNKNVAHSMGLDMFADFSSMHKLCSRFFTKLTKRTIRTNF